MAIETVMPAIGILVSSAGNFNIVHHSGPHEEDEQGDIGNTGHFHNEFDFGGSEGLEGMNDANIKPPPRKSRGNHAGFLPTELEEWRNCTFMHSMRSSGTSSQDRMSRANFLFRRGTRLSMQSHRLGLSTQSESSRAL